MYVQSQSLEGLGAINIPLPKYIGNKNSAIVKFALDKAKSELSSIGLDDIMSKGLFPAIESKLQTVGEQTAKKGIEEYTPILIAVGVGVALIGAYAGYKYAKKGKKRSKK